MTPSDTRPTLMGMRQVFLFLITVILSFPTHASSAVVDNDTAWLQALSQRVEGTVGEERAFDYIAKRLDELELSYTRASLSTPERGHSFSENITVQISGTSSRLYILAAPIDGAAFATALLLELCRRMKDSPPQNSVRLLFLGAERGSPPLHPYGSRYALERIPTESPAFAFYLDGENITPKWTLHPGGNGLVSPSWFIRETTESFMTNLLPLKISGTDVQIARLDLQENLGPFTEWLNSPIPSILLKGNGQSEENEHLEAITSILNVLVDIDQRIQEIPDTQESNYIFFRPFKALNPFIISESPYLIFFLSSIFALLILFFLKIRTIRLNFLRFIRYWWTLPLLFFLVFLFLFLSTLIIQETSLISNFSDLWIHMPGIFLFFKLTVTGILSFVFLLIMQGLPLPRSPHYYSYAALVSAAIALIFFLALDIFLAAYPLWTLINLIMVIATWKKYHKIIFLLASVIPYIVGVSVIIREPYERVIHSILLSPIAGNLIQTFFLLPLILSITSLGYWQHHFHRSRQSIFKPVSIILLSISTLLTLFWILRFQPYNVANPQPVELIDRIDLNTESRQIELSSPGPMYSPTLSLDNIPYPLSNLGRQTKIKVPLKQKPLSILQQHRDFLGRRTVKIEISGGQAPEHLSLSLRSQEPFTLHQASQPFEMNPAGDSAWLFVGINPSFPFNLGFTVNDQAKLSLIVEATWENPVSPPEISGKNLSGNSSRTVKLETILEE